GIHRAAERTAKGDVDAAPAELGVEPADHELRWAREVERDLRPGGRHHPRPGHRHAHLQAAALVRRAGRSRGDGCGAARRGEDEHASHGTLRKRNADSKPPTSSTTRAPPANRSVTSRFSVRWPMRVARCAYTAASAFAECTLKNSPPVDRASSCSVPGLGG